MNRENINILEYTALLAIFALCAYFFFSFRFSSYKQFLVIVFSAFSYVIWGTIHHLIRVRLYWHIIYEYILIAVLVVLLFAFSLNIL